MAVFGVGMAKIVVALLVAGRLRFRRATVTPSAGADAVQDLHDRLTASLLRENLWGVWLPASRGSRVEAQESTVLASFLRARRWSVDEAEEMFTSALAWRREIGVSSLRAGQFGPLPCDLVTRRDRQDRLCVIFRLSEVSDECFADTQLFVLWRVFMQEALNSRLDFREAQPGYTLVINCEGARPSHFGKHARACATELSRVFQGGALSLRTAAGQLLQCFRAVSGD